MKPVRHPFFPLAPAAARFLFACPLAHVRFLTLALALMLALLPSPARAADDNIPFSGKCIGVTEGDTIQVMRDGFPENIRLAGIDAPELKQSFGPTARKALSALTFLKPVTVRPRGRDEAGAILAVVVLTSPSLELNATLVRNGLAWHDRQTSDTRLASFQTLARKEGRGLWREHAPTPPWEFRRQAAEAADIYIPEAPMNGRDTVYVTKLGKTYHRKDCIAVRNWIAPISLADAINNGYTPCFACKPQEPETPEPQ
jgi:endonuclease YncB( thermonuclease family)